MSRGIVLAAAGGDNLGWLAIAFLAVWAGIGAYLLSLGVRQRRLEKRLRDLDAAGIGGEPTRARDG